MRSNRKYLKNMMSVALLHDLINYNARHLVNYGVRHTLKLL